MLPPVVATFLLLVASSLSAQSDADTPLTIQPCGFGDSAFVPRVWNYDASERTFSHPDKRTCIGASDDGSAALSQVCAPGLTSQQWIVHADGTVESVAHKSMCLNVDGGAVYKGTQIILYGCGSMQNPSPTPPYNHHRTFANSDPSHLGVAANDVFTIMPAPVSRVYANGSGLCLSAGDAPAEPCKDSLDCSLNGDCRAGTCACRAPWEGAQCERMRFKPVSFPQGYGMAPNLTSWGGNVLQGKDGRYHLYVSAMMNHCLLNTWGSNSRIEHGVSSSITGPYEFKDVAVDVWSHNSAPIALADGTYAIVHIGDGDGGHPANCTKEQRYGMPIKNNQGSAIHVATSLDGPWQPVVPDTLPSCNNPAPWVMGNGTIFMLCDSVLVRAEKIQGPWQRVTTVNLDHSRGYVGGNYEDPFLYTDEAGHFHLLWHVYNTNEDKYECVNSTVSAHFYSTDGFVWYSHSTQPFTTQVELASGTTITVSTRERPKLFFDASGKMTHLINGVCSATACPPPTGPKTGCVDCKYNNWDYTLIQPLDV